MSDLLGEARLVGSLCRCFFMTTVGVLELEARAHPMNRNFRAIPFEILTGGGGGMENFAEPPVMEITLHIFFIFDPKIFFPEDITIILSSWGTLELRVHWSFLVSICPALRISNGIALRLPCILKDTR